MLKRFWRSLIFGLKSRGLFLVGAAGVFYWLYVWRLGSLTAGLSPDEKLATASSTNLQNILDDPINAPHKLLQLIAHHLFGSSPGSLRAASTVLAGLFLVGFYSLVVRWFGRFIGIISTSLLAATPLVVISARQATPVTLYLAPIALLSAYVWLVHQKKWLNQAWLVVCLVAAFSLYVPGLIWLIGGSLIIGRQLFMATLRRLKPLYVWSGLLLLLFFISPLVYGLIKTPVLIKQLLLLPTIWPSALAILKEFLWSVSGFFLRTKAHFELTVGRVPILSVIQSALVVFGVYAMATLARKKLFSMLAVLFFSLLAAAFNRNPSLLLFGLPAVCVVAAAGLRYLFLEWQAIFPRNPLPKYLAYGLMILVALMQLNFGAKYSLSAWPHLPQTKQLYMIK